MLTICGDLEHGSGQYAYQIRREDCAAQPRWNPSEDLPVPLEKLCGIAVRETPPFDGNKGNGWKVEHISFFPLRDERRPLPVEDIPEDLQDRWYCIIQLSNYGDFTGEWWTRSTYAVLLLDGTYVKLSVRKGGN